MYQIFRENLHRVHATYLFLQQRQLDNMEIFVQIGDLVQILGLHFVPGLAHRTRLLVDLFEQQLIDDDVVRVDSALGQLLEGVVYIYYAKLFRKRR
jgi:hypothetical protein